MGKLQKLFSPIKICNVELKNRVVMSPIVTNFAGTDGQVTDQYENFLVERAKGEVGLIFAMGAYIREDGRLPFSGQLGISNDRFIPGLKRLTEAVHGHGAKIGCQLHHAGRQTKSSVTGAQPVAPSAIPCPVFKEMPRELSKKDIEELVEDYAKAAKRAKEAGFDMVEVHAAHGYLIAGFLSPYSNKRTDEYGGDVQGRTRFVVEVVKRVKEETGKNFPVISRISAEEGVKGGLTLEDSKVISQILVEAGEDAIHVSTGNFERPDLLIPTKDSTSGCHVHLAEEIKSLVKVPVIARGKIDDPFLAEEILQQGKADLIAMGRPLLADPYLVKKAAEGKFEQIVKCTACNEGCLGKLFENQPITCVQNPKLGKE